MSATAGEWTRRFQQVRDEALTWKSGARLGLDVFGTVASWDGFCWAEDWFDHLAALTPHQVALDLPLERCRLTYAEVSARSHAAAHWLGALGVGAGTVVRVALPETSELWVVLLALDRLGAVIVHVQPHLPPTEVLRRTPQGIDLTHITPEGFRASGGHVERFPDWSEPSVRYAANRLPANLPMWGYFTSGTTKDPKLVMHNRVSYAVGHLSSVAFHALQPGQRHSNLAGPGWAKFAWSALYVPFSSHGTYVALSGLAPSALLSALADHRVDSVCASPTTWARCTEGAVSSVKLKQTFCAGEPLPAAVADTIAELTGVAPRSVFGMTEMTAALGEPVAGAGLRPLPGYAVRASPTPQGTGLQIRAGLPMMIGYASEGVHVANPIDASLWFTTGDAVKRLPSRETMYAIPGRLDDLINVDGHLRSPSDLEQQLETIPGVEEAMVFQLLDAEGAFAWWTGNPEAMDHRLPHFLNHARWVEALPVTPSGKLHRRHAALLEHDRRTEHDQITTVEGVFP